MSDQIPAKGTPEYAESLKYEVARLNFLEDAKSVQRSSGWTPPPEPGTATEQLAQGVPDIDWIIKDLFPAGICQVNAQQKAGKTTLALNMAHSLLTGNEFLGRFKTSFGSDEAIGYLNLELDKQMFLSWLSDFGMKDELKRLHLYHAREKGFGRPDLRNDIALTWFVEWVARNNITMLVIDTLSKLYDPSQWGGGSDPNLAYNRFWQVLETLKRDGGLRGIFILHHTGYSEDGANRARGASAMMDNPDVNMTYRHEGNQGGAAPNNVRWLSANERIEPVAEFELDFKVSGRRLFATGSTNKRGDVNLRADAIKLWEYLNEKAKAGTSLIEKTDLLKDNGLSSGGSGLKKSNDVLTYGMTEGWLLSVPNGKKKLFGKGTEEPPVVERKVFPINALAKATTATTAKSLQGRLGS
ncbi:AAA family ATPase [Mycobacterium intracellulare]|uniref:AAA family ATPase n=1 Tax=Mycobacterium intracellulare TaxID=1767 RepID=UPI0019166E34|nr:AAA family ATPase [Mycobacterium intracellulare]